MPQPVISIIIPTLGTAARAPVLWRAIDSVLGQARVRAVPIVVVNGPEVGRGVLDALRCRTDVRLAELSHADMPEALRRGRELVDTAYFSELDDDDELLPAALDTRRTMLERERSADVVVSNGIIRGRNGETYHLQDAASVRADPLRAILSRNWLAPGSALFRTERVTADFFDGIPRYLEWTALGLRLALRCRIIVSETPDFVHHTDHAFSVTNSNAYTLGLPAAIRGLLDLPVPEDVRAAITAKLAPALHAASVHALANGHLRDAWTLHGQSLQHAGGLRYWTFTRRLLAAGLLAPWRAGPNRAVAADDQGDAADRGAR